MSIPCVETQRLQLRGLALEDTDDLYTLWNNPEVSKYFPNTSPPKIETVQNIIKYQFTMWERYGYGWWAVILRDSSELLGWCGLQYLPETDETEVGYLLGQVYWAKGYATEAAQASIKYGFETLRLKEIIGVVHPQNQPSIHVIEKLGMTFVDRTYYFGMQVFRYRIQHAPIAE